MINGHKAGTDVTLLSLKCESEGLSKRHKDLLDNLIKKYGDDFAIHYDDLGFPDFSRFKKAGVDLGDRATGTRGDHSRAWSKLRENYIEEYGKEEAKKRLKELRNGPEALTWHHTEAGELILIPRDIHEAYRHTGSASVLRRLKGDSTKVELMGCGAVFVAIFGSHTERLLENKPAVDITSFDLFDAISADGLELLNPTPVEFPSPREAMEEGRTLDNYYGGRPPPLPTYKKNGHPLGGLVVPGY